MLATWSRLGPPCEWSTLIPIFILCCAGPAAASTHYDPTGGSCLIVHQLNHCVVPSISAWLYWRGLNLGLREGCEPSIFLFTSIGAYNPKWIIASKVVNTIILVVGGRSIFLSACWLLLWKRFERMGEAGHLRNQSYRPIVFTGLLLTGAIAIAFVEMTIKDNQITFPNASLTDSGQLTPLLIGVFTLASVFWEGFTNLIKGMK